MGLFDGPSVTDAQRELVAMTDARTGEWYLEAEIAMLNMRVSELEAALKPFANEADEYEGLGVQDKDKIFVPLAACRQARKVLGKCGE